MPELPEVETVRRILAAEILNKTVIDVKIYYSKIIENEADYFKKSLIGNNVTSMSRLGKYLIFNLNTDKSIISHLRMEGKFFYVDETYPLNKHIHLEIYFFDGKKLMYQDVRKFGRFVIKDTLDLYTCEPLSKLGMEPFDSNLSKEVLYKSLRNKKIPIKTALLDQKVILGLGNIYVDEVLFAAKILPYRPANEVSLEECDKIIKNSKIILEKSILEKGTTIRSYTSSLNVIGNYQNFLMVHTKEKCGFCQSSIYKIKIGGRTSYYCKNCQK